MNLIIGFTATYICLLNSRDCIMISYTRHRLEYANNMLKMAKSLVKLYAKIIYWMYAHR